MTSAEAIKFLEEEFEIKLTTRALERYRQLEKIPFIRLGKRCEYQKSALRKWIENKRKGPSWAYES